MLIIGDADGCPPVGVVALDPARMPIRPPLLAFHPRSPRPPRQRSVHCPSCRHGFSLTRRAVSVRCPKCATPIAFDDLTLGQRVEGTITTMGRVTLRDTCGVRGRLTCGMLEQSGKFDGDATVYGPAVLQAGSRTTGTLVARSVTIEAGAKAVCRLKITPNPGPPPTPGRRTIEQVRHALPQAAHGLPRVVPNR
ncbi:MAG: polymer-forming cytoskeletal protein [Planctomycetota bacterium]